MISPFEVYLKEQKKHFQSSGSVSPVSFSYKEADTNPAAGLMLFHTFDVDSCEIQEILLDSINRYAILEELDYLCNLNVL